MPRKLKSKHLTLTVEGTRLNTVVAIDKLASSKAGKTGFDLNIACTCCGERINAPRICRNNPVVKQAEVLLSAQNLGGLVVGLPTDSENTQRRYEDPQTGKVAYLTNEQVKALRPRGDNTISIFKMLDAKQAGGIPTPMLRRLMPATEVITPAEVQDIELYSMVYHLIGDRCALARIMHKGSFYSAMLFTTPQGAITVHELFLPQDTDDIPSVALAALPENVKKATAKKGAELTKGEKVNLEELDIDPTREARREAIEAALGTAVERRVAEMSELARPRDLLELLG